MPSLLSKIESRLFQHPSFTGLHLQMDSQGQWHFHWVTLERQQEEVNIKKTGEGIFDLENPEGLPDPEIPVHLILDGRGILHKAVPEQTLREEAVLQALLPGAKSEDFILQQVPYQKGSIASLIRQDLAVQLLEQFEHHSFWILGVSLGPFDVACLQPFLKDQSKIHVGKNELQFDEQGQLCAYQQLEEENTRDIKLEGQAIPAEKVLPYAAAFQGILELPAALTHQAIADQQQEYRHKQLFGKALLAMAGVTLLVLLLNTAFYFHYKSENEKLGIGRYHTQNQLAELDSLKAQLQRQQLLIKNTSINQQTTVSFYADQIAATLPEGLQLKELDIFPVNGRRKDYGPDQLVRYNKNSIIVKGWCKSSLTYNKWIRELKDIDWIKDARHIDYQDLNSQLSAFELHLNL